jgi:HEAT repeat protein
VARAAIPQATLALGHAAPEVRRTGADALALLAANGDEALPDLARALGDPDPGVRVAVLSALGEFGPSARSFAATVADRLARGDTPEERAAAVYTLAGMGVPAEHVDVLVTALLGDVPAVQAGAAWALAAALESEEESERAIVSAALHRLHRR